MTRPVCLALALLALTILPATAATADERPPTPRPVPPVPASALATDDDVLRPGQPLPGDDPVPGHDPAHGLSAAERDLVARALATAGDGDLGGTDVRLGDLDDAWGARLAIDQDGRVFVAVTYITGTGEYVDVFRSTDAGTSFAPWGRLGSPDSGSVRLTDLDVATGSTPRLFATTMASEPGDLYFSTRVSWADPGADAPIWTSTEPVTLDGPTYHGSLALDDRSFDAYYVYLAYSGDDGDGNDIWFVRSTDQGQTWETPYRIGELTGGENLVYRFPRVDYGFGGVVHVAWTYSERNQDTFDDAVRYRRAIDYAGSPGSWQSGPVVITSAFDGFNDVAVDLTASLDDDTVLLAYGTGTGSLAGVDLRHSTDGGFSWPLDSFFDLTWEGGRFVYQRPTGQFVGVVSDFTDARRVGIIRASTASPASWSGPQTFTDAANAPLVTEELALDPSRDEQVAVLARTNSSTGFDLYFDAEWRGEPGIPNLDHGTPLALDAPAASPPALYDLDQDGDQEILFGDTAGRIQAFHHDGTPVAGWPVTIPDLSSTPVAVARLNFSTVSVLAGSDDGRVWALDAGGEVQPGWPYQMEATGPTYVSVGALGGPYPRTVIVGTDNRIKFLNYAGTEPLDTFGWILIGTSVSSPAAVGDIDGDGVSEAVLGAGDLVAAYELYDYDLQLSVNLPTEVSGMVSLADLDLDGRVEVVVPTEAGSLYVLDGQTGDVWPGFPFTTPSGTRLTSAAVAQILGNSPPEIAVSARNWTTHVLYADGDEQNGYPVTPGDGWYAIASPIMGRVDGFSGDVVCVSRGGDVWAFDNFGATVTGWPQPVRSPNQFELTPAMGDIDQDGHSEIVAVDHDLVIIDTGSEPHAPASTWPMFAHDAQRTGCADCPEDVVTPVEPDQPDQLAGITRVRFAGAAPNPLAGPSTEFRFAVPARAFARVEIYDVRGRHVRSLLRSEVPAGEHVVAWDGRDARGRPVSSGQYLARLQVRGPGVSEQLTRAVTVLR